MAGDGLQALHQISRLSGNAAFCHSAGPMAKLWPRHFAEENPTFAFLDQMTREQHKHARTFVASDGAPGLLSG